MRKLKVKQNRYHVGLLINNKGTARLQLVRVKDALCSMQLYDYYGTTDKTRKEITAELEKNKDKISAELKSKYRKFKLLSTKTI